MGEAAVEVLDGSPAGLPEPAVDVSDLELDLVALSAVLGSFKTRWNKYLQHRGRLRALRILFQEAFERAQLLGDSFRIVEPVDAEDEPLPGIPFVELGVLSGCVGIGERFRERADVDADRIHADTNETAVELDDVGLGVDSEHAKAR